MPIELVIGSTEAAERPHKSRPTDTRSLWNALYHLATSTALLADDDLAKGLPGLATTPRASKLSLDSLLLSFDSTLAGSITSFVFWMNVASSLFLKA